MPLSPPCELSGDYLNTMQDHLREILTVINLIKEERGYQLDDLTEFSRIIREKINKRIDAKGIAVSVDWSKELISVLNLPKDDEEKKALEEKTNALNLLSSTRFAVLLGAAGTGKTTLLSVLTKNLIKLGERVLFLAPTGKARVRMQEKPREKT